MKPVKRELSHWEVRSEAWDQYVEHAEYELRIHTETIFWIHHVVDIHHLIREEMNETS